MLARQIIDCEIGKRPQSKRQYAFIHFIERRVIGRRSRWIDAFLIRSEENKKSGGLLRKEREIFRCGDRRLNLHILGARDALQRRQHLLG